MWSQKSMACGWAAWQHQHFCVAVEVDGAVQFIEPISQHNVRHSGSPNMLTPVHFIQWEFYDPGDHIYSQKMFLFMTYCRAALWILEHWTEVRLIHYVSHNVITEKYFEWCQRVLSALWRICGWRRPLEIMRLVQWGHRCTTMEQKTMVNTPVCHKTCALHGRMCCIPRRVALWFLADGSPTAEISWSLPSKSVLDSSPSGAIAANGG